MALVMARFHDRRRGGGISLRHSTFSWVFAGQKNKKCLRNDTDHHLRYLPVSERFMNTSRSRELMEKFHCKAAFLRNAYVDTVPIRKFSTTKSPPVISLTGCSSCSTGTFQASRKRLSKTFEGHSFQGKRRLSDKTLCLTRQVSLAR